MIDGVEYPWNISDKKEHERSSCPEEVIVDEVEGFADLLSRRYRSRRHELRDHVLHIGTAPRPAPELLVLRSDGTDDIRLGDQIHLTDSGSVDDTEESTPSEVTPPVLHPIFHDRVSVPVVRLMQTRERLTVDREVAIELRILALEELPHRRPDPDDTSEEVTSSPVVGVDGCILVDRMMTIVRGEERVAHYREKVWTHLGICIDSRDEGMFWIECTSLFLLHSLITLDRVGDIGSFYSSLVRQVGRVDDVHYMDPLIPMIGDDVLRMCLSIWSARLGSKQYGEILPIEVLGREEREDILLDHIVWLSIYRDDDDMLELGPSLHDDRIM